MTHTKRIHPEVARLKGIYSTTRATVRAEVEAEVEKRVVTVRTQLELAVVNAYESGYKISEIARSMGTSDRNTVYKILRDYENMRGVLEAGKLPHSDIFTKTGELYNEVTMRIPRTLKGLGIEAGTKIVCYAGYHPQQGWIFDPEKTAPNRTLLVPLIGPRGTIHDPQLRVEFEEWADAYWPEMKDRPDYRDTMEAREGRLKPMTGATKDRHTEEDEDTPTLEMFE